MFCNVLHCSKLLVSPNWCSDQQWDRSLFWQSRSIKQLVNACDRSSLRSSSSIRQPKEPPQGKSFQRCSYRKSRKCLGTQTPEWISCPKNCPAKPWPDCFSFVSPQCSDSGYPCSQDDSCSNSWQPQWICWKTSKKCGVPLAVRYSVALQRCSTPWTGAKGDQTWGSQWTHCFLLFCFKISSLEIRICSNWREMRNLLVCFQWGFHFCLAILGCWPTQVAFLIANLQYNYRVNTGRDWKSR